MFGKWFKKKDSESDTTKATTDKSHVTEVAPEMSEYFHRYDATPQLEYDVYATAEKARARARYELSGRLMGEYAAWYKASIIDNPYPNDSIERREDFKLQLVDAEAAPAQMVLAAADRDAVLAFVDSAKVPVSREQIESACPIHWDVKYGVFLNQLVRGNWLNETGKGKERSYTISSTKRVPDDVFLKTERVE